MDSEQPRVRISRRKVLKQIGTGAAIAWSAPILTSIETPAFAESRLGCDPRPTCSPRPTPPRQPCNGNPDCQCYMLWKEPGNPCCCGQFTEFFCPFPTKPDCAN